MPLRILMVDDEADLVSLMARRLARVRPGISFDGFADPLRALASLRTIAPDVLVTDERMPTMSGLELIGAARAMTPDLPAIIVTAAPTRELRNAIAGDRDIELLEKPTSFEQLLAAIERAVARRTAPTKGFSGRLRLPMLPDLIQVLAQSRASVSVEVRDSTSAPGRNAVPGWIWFEVGEVVHAVHGERTGPDAFYSLLALEKGQFSTEACERAPGRTIDARWEELLMEGLRRVDEVARGTAPEEEPRAGTPAFAPDELRHLRQAIPAGDGSLVVVAFRPSVERSSLVLGGRETDVDSWNAFLLAVSGALTRLSAEPDGFFEDVRDDVAVAFSWSRPDDRVVLLAQALESAHAISRFRQRAAGFHRAAGPSPAGGSPVRTEGGA